MLFSLVIVVAGQSSASPRNVLRLPDEVIKGVPRRQSKMSRISYK